MTYVQNEEMLPDILILIILEVLVTLVPAILTSMLNL